ncbi:MAG: hypothetical protein ACREYC_16360, partial [Gammaproteobacteria bacterium]
TIALFFHPAAPEGVLQEGNKRAEKTIRAAGSHRDAVVVPFHLGPKHTGSMQFSRRIEDMLHGVRARYDGREILPHANVVLWLKKMANQRMAPRKTGVVIMPHGAGEYLNEPILKAVEPLVSRYDLEVAFGMADTEMLQEAIDRLEDRGATHILVLRLYATSLSLRDETEYILGLRERWPLHGHGHGSSAADPPRVRASAVLATAGGLDADPLISEVLLQRAAEVSVAPESETVILLAHGSGLGGCRGVLAAAACGTGRFYPGQGAARFSSSRVCHRARRLARKTRAGHRKSKKDDRGSRKQRRSCARGRGAGCGRWPVSTVSERATLQF